MRAVASRIGLRADARVFTREDDLLALRARRRRERNGELDCVRSSTRRNSCPLGAGMQLSDVVDVLDVPVLAYGPRTDFRAASCLRAASTCWPGPTRRDQDDLPHRQEGDDGRARRRARSRCHRRAAG